MRTFQITARRFYSFQVQFVWKMVDVMPQKHIWLGFLSDEITVFFSKSIKAGVKRIGNTLYTFNINIIWQKRVYRFLPIWFGTVKIRIKMKHLRLGMNPFIRSTGCGGLNRATFMDLSKCFFHFSLDCAFSELNLVTGKMRTVITHRTL